MFLSFWTFFWSDFFNFQHYRKISPSLVVKERSRWNGVHSNLFKPSGRQTNTTNEIHNTNWNLNKKQNEKRRITLPTYPLPKDQPQVHTGSTAPEKSKTPASLYLPQGPMDGLDGLNVWKAREIKKTRENFQKFCMCFCLDHLCSLCIRYMYHPGNSS